jgi:hypothetical protein
MASNKAVGEAILEMKAAFPGVWFDDEETQLWAKWLEKAPDDAVLKAAESFSHHGDRFPKFPDFLERVVFYINVYRISPDDDLTQRREELLQGDFDPEAWEACAQELEDAGRGHAAEAMRRRIQGYLELENEPA